MRLGGHGQYDVSVRSVHCVLTRPYQTKLPIGIWFHATILRPATTLQRITNFSTECLSTVLFMMVCSVITAMKAPVINQMTNLMCLRTQRKIHGRERATV